MAGAHFIKFGAIFFILCMDCLTSQPTFANASPKANEGKIANEKAFDVQQMEYYEIGYEPYNEEQLKARTKGQDCRDECDMLVGYGAGLCSSISGFGANIACFLITFTNPLHCGAIQGVIFAFGGYCTSSAPGRLCALCSEGYSIKMVLDRELLINNEVKRVVDLQRDLDIVREEISVMTKEWHTKQLSFESDLRSAGHFEDVDHLLHLMSLIEYTPGGIPIDNHALKIFLDTALSPARHGVLNLINKFHRLFAGGGHCIQCFGGRKSIFEINSTHYCQTHVVTQLDNALFGCYHAFFFAMKLKGEETEKYEKAFAVMRKQEFEEYALHCQKRANRKEGQEGTSDCTQGCKKSREDWKPGEPFWKLQF